MSYRFERAKNGIIYLLWKMDPAAQRWCEHNTECIHRSDAVDVARRFLNESDAKIVGL